MTQNKLIKWNNEKRSISDLIPAAYNPRKLSDIQKNDLNKSLTRFNLADPIVINKNNIIIGGHQRIVVLKENGVSEVDVRVPDRLLTENEEKELNLRLNKNLGEFDLGLLAEFSADMLKDVGFDSSELDRIFSLSSDEEDDVVPETPEIPKTKIGDIYQLGRHRLMCGDCVDLENINKLMGDQKADMVFTDPPYNVDYEGYTEEKLKISGDKKSLDDFKVSLKDWFVSYRMAIKAGASLYICHPFFYQREFQDALEANEFNIRCQIIWSKSNFAWGFGRYKYQHETIFYVYIKGQSDSWYGDKTQSTLWQFDKPSVNKVHPTMKPVELIVRAIVNSSKHEDIILDLFMGSGSTLIASEKTNRICYGMEIEPKYCDVIVKRWEDYTEQKAVKCLSGDVVKSADVSLIGS